MKYSASDTGICVIGGGNIGTQFACAFASRGYSVRILSSRPGSYDGELEIVDENGRVTRGRTELVTSDYSEAVKGCRLIFVTHPAFRFGEIADPTSMYLSDMFTISLNIVGNGGLSLPIGLGSESGLPVSLQIVGPQFRDENILRVAAALERCYDIERLAPLARSGEEGR